MFGAKLRYFENNVQFVQKVKFTKPNYDIDADLEYGACNDQSCLPPSSCSLKKAGK
jgi:thiol:disulfide interchange protein DsbD